MKKTSKIKSRRENIFSLKNLMSKRTLKTDIRITSESSTKKSQIFCLYQLKKSHFLNRIKIIISSKELLVYQKNQKMGFMF